MNKKKISVLVILLICFVWAVGTNESRAQNGDVWQYMHGRLQDVPADGPEIRTYEITVKRQATDPVDGTKLFADAARGSYHVLNGDSIHWSNVSTMPIENLHRELSEGKPLPFLENLTYRTGSTPFAYEEFYQAIPLEQMDWSMMLLTDAYMLHEYKLSVLDSLEFGEPYYPESMKDYDVEMSGLEFTFSSDYVQYLWNGFTLYEGALCAVVQFESFFNPMSNSRMKGRSMYYGELFVSLENHQIEYARMVEDAMLRLKDSKEQWMDLQRVVVLKTME